MWWQPNVRRQQYVPWDYNLHGVEHMLGPNLRGRRDLCWRVDLRWFDDVWWQPHLWQQQYLQ
ncbi:MAG TPA: hypothetical protein VFI02_18510 [Armatimonadota bacterium]|nr:hypothetical protein [Armatimonadota bacterium]